MGTDPPRHPRVSPRVKRWLNWVLTGIWLVGGAVVLEFLHISLWAEIALVAVLLGVVLLVELVFFRWNEGRWPAVETAGNRDESNAGPRRTADYRWPALTHLLPVFAHRALADGSHPQCRRT